MNGKRITIYDLAEELGVSASYISRALNDYPGVSKKIKEQVKKKAKELNYKQNSHAANLRQGFTKIVGVIVPHINQSFFSEAIAGIEEVCFEHGHSLIICQSHESYEQECKGIETLIHHNVDCILISISAETKSSSQLQDVIQHDIELIQFDRCLDSINSHKVINDNKQASANVVKSLISQGYKKIAFIGGPNHIEVFKSRKDGYLEAIKEAGLLIPYNFIVDNALSKEKAIEVASELMDFKERPDAFFTVSDLQSLGVLEVARSLGVEVPRDLGIFGFANEYFTELITPTLSSVDQKSKELGRRAAQIYFDKILKNKEKPIKKKEEVVTSEVIIRESSVRSRRRPAIPEKKAKVLAKTRTKSKITG